MESKPTSTEGVRAGINGVKPAPLLEGDDPKGDVDDYPYIVRGDERYPITCAEESYSRRDGPASPSLQCDWHTYYFGRDVPLPDYVPTSRTASVKWFYFEGKFISCETGLDATALSCNFLRPWDEESYEPPEATMVRTHKVTYRGKPLNCFIHQKSGDEESALACDFETYYTVHPEMLESPGESAEDAPYSIPLEWFGRMLPCYSDEHGVSCDFPRYHALADKIPVKLSVVPGATAKAKERESTPAEMEE